MRHLRQLALLAVAALVLPACESGDDGPPGPAGPGAASRHEWDPAVTIESSASPINEIGQPAMNAAGDALAIWTQGDDIRAARYTTAGGWTAAATLDSRAEPAHSPRVVLDASGNAIAVWVQSDGTADSVWAARFTPAGGWDAAVLLESSAPLIISSPRLAGDASGNAIVVWPQSDGAVVRIWQNTFTGGAWAGAAILDTNAAAAASWPAVAMNDAGHVMAVWSQSGIVGRRFVPGPGWEAVAAVGTASGAADTQVAMSATGEAVAVWARSVTGVPRRGANRSSTTGVWGAETLIDAGGSTSLPGHNLHRVAMDDFGFGMAVWSQPQDSGTVSMWHNRLTPAGWAGPALLETSSTLATGPSLAMEPNGAALAAWNEGTSSVSRLFDPSGGWDPIEVVDATGSSPEVALNADGIGLAVFFRGGDLWAAFGR